MSNQLTATMNPKSLSTLTLKSDFPTDRVPELLWSLFAGWTWQGRRQRALQIPIDFFDRNEAVIRKWMRAHQKRAIYRGPRRTNRCHWRDSRPTMTRRCDAKGVQFGFAG